MLRPVVLVKPSADGCDAVVAAIRRMRRKKSGGTPCSAEAVGHLPAFRRQSLSWTATTAMRASQAISRADMTRVVIASAEGKAKAALHDSNVDPKHAERVFSAADDALAASWAAEADANNAVAAAAAAREAADAAAAVASRNAAEEKQKTTAGQAASSSTPVVVYLSPLSEWE